MRKCAVFVTVLTLLAAPGAAQSTTEDGIRALLGGEYQTAAAMLWPRAYDAQRPDPVAQFFLAVLYETDMGVPFDQTRACALFTQAAARPNPFSQQAAASAASLRGQMGAAACVAEERLPGAPPQTLRLERSDHPVPPRTATADGVVAMARGDYQRAAESLKPIAENRRPEDIAAEFFMAGLYETGRGVPHDPLRACALYQRASDDYDAPFGRQAAALFGASVARGLEFFDECQFLAGIGWDHGFEPATFVLGPGHFVDWTLRAATVTHDGRTKPTAIDFEPELDEQFLPLQHTELATGPTRSLARHFVGVFRWIPSVRSSAWTLDWNLFEIVGSDVIRIDIHTIEPIAMVNGNAPPSRQTFDVREYAVVRVDDEGNAEWATLKGSHRQSQRIPTDAERREVREHENARRAARARVDWNRKYDVHRPPTMAYIDADGCGHVQLYGWTADHAGAIVVRVDGAALSLSTQLTSFDLARESADISIEAHVYSTPQLRFEFCSDVRVRPAPGSIAPETWRAIAGTISVQLSPPGVRSNAPDLRRAAVTLRDVVLQNPAGATVKMSRPVTLTAIVGWGY